MEMGANAVWAVALGGTMAASGDWCAVHREKIKNEEWSKFWERVATLQKIGALWFEPWLFDGTTLDAEPLFPVDTLDGRSHSEDATGLTLLARRVVEALAGARHYLLEQSAGRTVVVLPAHHRPPSIRGVAKLRVEPDTPGRRLSFAKRRELLERHETAYLQLLSDIDEGRYNRPIRLG
jgi:hypothetical protein